MTEQQVRRTTQTPHQKPALRTVGVLGGMGPEATVLLMSRIISATPARDDCDHIPLLVDHNPQVPSRIRALLESEGDDPGPVLVRMAARLVAAGAEALALPCNTAHAYAPALRGVGVPFLDMIEMTADSIAADYGAGCRVGLLASPAVARAGVYDRAFATRGLEPVFTDQPDLLLTAIKRLKRDAQDPQAPDIQRRIAHDLLGRGCDLLLVSCTELSLISHAVPPGAQVRDSLDLLVTAICDFSCGDGVSFESTSRDSIGAS